MEFFVSPNEFTDIDQEGYLLSYAEKHKIKALKPFQLNSLQTVINLDLQDLYQKQNKFIYRWQKVHKYKNYGFQFHDSYISSRVLVICSFYGSIIELYPFSGINQLRETGHLGKKINLNKIYMDFQPHKSFKSVCFLKELGLQGFYALLISRFKSIQ